MLFLTAVLKYYNIRSMFISLDVWKGSTILMTFKSEWQTGHFTGQFLLFTI